MSTITASAERVQEEILLEHAFENRCARIAGKHFTSREVDIMACLLHSRGTSKIASFLHISPRTVTTHIHNILTKLDGCSREIIIDFIEDSGEIFLFRHAYLTLRVRSQFENFLCQKKVLFKGKVPQNLNVELEDSNLYRMLKLHLRHHLSLANINVQLRFGCDMIFFKGSRENEQLKQNYTYPLENENNYYQAFFYLLNKLFPDLEIKKLTTESQNIMNIFIHKNKNISTRADPYFQIPLG